MTAVQTLPSVVRADDVPGPKQGKWTYASYAAIPDDGKRYEVVDVVLYRAITPNTQHQSSLVHFIFHLATHIQFAGLVRVYPIRTDVQLSPRTILQPDVIVIFNANLS